MKKFLMAMIISIALCMSIGAGIAFAATAWIDTEMDVTGTITINPPEGNYSYSFNTTDLNFGDIVLGLDESYNASLILLCSNTGDVNISLWDVDVQGDLPEGFNISASGDILAGDSGPVVVVLSGASNDVGAYNLSNLAFNLSPSYSSVAEAEPEPEGNVSANESGNYTVATFSGSGSWAVPAGVNSVEILVVAGGGAGGGQNVAGGGGAGGLVFNSAYSTTPGENISFTVGAGGTGYTNAAGGNGSNSIFGTITALGGGGGGYNPTSDGTAGYAGGSGGGGAGGGTSYGAGGAGNASQGYNGGHGASSDSYGGGGGGGAGAVGSNAGTNGGNGGNGVAYNISGDSIYYAGGGGGAANAGTKGLGGLGGGGNGSRSTDAAVDGTDGLGGGGGGATGTGTHKGGDGGDGIIILRYPTD